MSEGNMTEQRNDYGLNFSPSPIDARIKELEDRLKEYAKLYTAHGDCVPKVYELQCEIDRLKADKKGLVEALKEIEKDYDSYGCMDCMTGIEAKEALEKFGGEK